METGLSDLTTYNEGSLVGFSAHTDAGREFLSERLDSEPWQWLGPTLWVDHRCASGIVSLALDEGLTFDQGGPAESLDARLYQDETPLGVELEVGE